MRKLPYFVVDVFTGEALKGNPLAVVLDEVGLSAEEMLRIAREFHLSETTFVRRGELASERTNGVAVRIYTMQEELPFAGHPTLGTAAILQRIAPEVVVEGEVGLALKVGRIPVRFDPATGFGQMRQRDPEFGAVLDPERVAALIGLRAEDIDPNARPQIVSTGTGFGIVPLRSAESLARLVVDQKAARTWLDELGARWFYVLGPTGDTNPAWRARMQFHGGEDPATGSAAGCAISYLVEHGLAPSGEEVHLRQGVEIERQSEIYLSAEKLSDGRVINVRVGGETVVVAEGTLLLN